MPQQRMPDERYTLRDTAPLLFVHLLALMAIPVGVSAPALVALAVTYVVRVFALTGGYHRYFSHKSFKTGRFFQFLLAFAGASAAQLGPLWWASHHRRHHQVADTEDDIHSPVRRGFFWAHIGWLMCPRYRVADMDRIRDFAKVPELRWLDRYCLVPPLALMALLYGAGEWMAAARPAWGADGGQLVAWGFFVSTVLVYHVTFSINSLMHMTGARRYPTPDTSRNNWILALLTMGEGWHNNHHRFSVSARQGFRWWELDLTYGILRVLSWFRIVWDLREPPRELMRRGAA